MLQGLEVMLERMKTHPEEFVVQNKYTRAVHRVRDFLTDEELEALKVAVATAHRDYFNGEVLAIMAGEHDEETLSYEDTSLVSVVMKDMAKKYNIPIAKSLFSGSNGTTTPSAFGAVPVKAEGASVTFSTYDPK